MRPPHPAPWLKPTGSRTVDRGIWFDMVDLVPRYPAIDNEIDERAVNLDRSAPIRCQLAENIGAQRPPQIHRIDVRAPINCSSCSSWRNNRDGCRAPQPQGDHKNPARIDNIACYQWPKDRITRLGSLEYRVKPPDLNPNRPRSADRAPRADLRWLGPCSLQIVAIKMV